MTNKSGPSDVKTNRRSRYFSSSDEEEGSGHEDGSSQEARSTSPTVAGSNQKPNTNPIDPDSRVVDPEKQPSEPTQFTFTETGQTRPQKTASVPRARFQEIADKSFHLFYWLSAVPEYRDADRHRDHDADQQPSKEYISFTLDNQGLEQRVSQLQKYLKMKSRTGHRAYIRCPSHSLDDVEDQKTEIIRLTRERERTKNDRAEEDIESELRAVRAARRYSQRYKGKDFRSRRSSESATPPDLYRGRRSLSGSSKSTDVVITVKPNSKVAKSIVRIAKQLFVFFFPLAYSSSMTSKYWGALHWLLQVSFNWI